MDNFSVESDPLLPVMPRNGELNPDAEFTKELAVDAVQAWVEQSFLRKRGFPDTLSVTHYYPSNAYILSLETFTGTIV